jgi:hypothetical protein
VTTLRDLISQKLDVEGFEDIDPEVLADTLEGIEGTLTEKVDAIAGLLGLWKRHEEGIAAEIKRLQSRKSVFANRQKRLKEYLAFQLGRLNEPKIETDLHTAALRKGQLAVVIDDEEALPEECIKVTRTPDKAAIKQALKGGELQGAHLQRGPDYVVLS